MEGRISKYVELSKQDPEKSKDWAPMHKDDMTRLYRVSEKNGKDVTEIIIAVAEIERVTAGEMVAVFHSQDLKMKWDQSIEMSSLLENKDEFCSVYHQVQKRIWPSAQRDFVYESHKQKLGEGENPDWVVCNVSCEHSEAPDSKYCRATIEVVFYCQTIVSGDPSKRENVKCKIFYSAKIDPGGWVPAAAIKAAANSEYPKFIKNIGKFAQNHVKDAGIVFWFLGEIEIWLIIFYVCVCVSRVRNLFW